MAATNDTVTVPEEAAAGQKMGLRSPKKLIVCCDGQ